MFEVGQTVRVIGAPSRWADCIGEVGEVNKVYRGGYYGVMFGTIGGGKRYVQFKESELGLVEPEREGGK